jgi:prevent-host-death family protein
MKTVAVRDARRQFSELIHGGEVVLITSHGKATAVLYPLTDPEKVPMEVRKDVFFAFSQKMAEALKAGGVTEDAIQRDFEKFKKRRRDR